MGTHVASGSKIFVYPDGSSKQVDVDGSGVIIAKDGTRTDFTYGGDAAFEADRIASDKRPLDEAEENEAIPVSLLNDPLGSAGGYVNQVPGVGMATEYANKVPGVGMATSVAGKTKDRCCQLGKMIPGAKQAEEMAGKAKGMAGQVPGVGAVGDLTSGNVPGVGAVGDLAGKVPGAGQLKGMAGKVPGVGAVGDLTNNAEELYGKVPGVGTARDIANKVPGVSTARNITDGAKDRFCAMCSIM